MTRVGSSLALWALLLDPIALVAGSREAGIGVTTGPILSCHESDGDLTIDVGATEGIVHIKVSDSQLPPWPHVSYPNLLPQKYRIAGPCPRTHEYARVTQCTGCQGPVVDAIELGGVGRAFDDTKRQLWVVRQFVDAVAGGDTGERQLIAADLFMTAMVLARYNRDDRGSRSVWVRDRVERALFTYSTTSRAVAMVERFGNGRKELTDSIKPLRDTYQKYGGQIGLVKSLPYMPEDPRDSPFVGSWGTFASEVYVEDSHGLTRVFRADLIAR